MSELPVITSEGEEFYLDGVHYGSKRDILLTGILRLCGCGQPDAALDRIVEILKLVQDEHRGWTVDEEIILHLLDSKDLLEHGVGIGCPWVTEKGLWFLVMAMDVLTEEPKHDPTFGLVALRNQS